MVEASFCRTGCLNYMCEPPESKGVRPHFSQVTLPITIPDSTIAENGRDTHRNLLVRFAITRLGRPRPEPVLVRHLPLSLPPCIATIELVRAAVPSVDRDGHGSLAKCGSGRSGPSADQAIDRDNPGPPHRRSPSPSSAPLATIEPPEELDWARNFLEQAVLNWLRTSPGK